jgi:hypothetical protein
VPQQAWIQNATFEDNITFAAATKNRPFYDAIVEACALMPDLKSLHGGNRAEIGEKVMHMYG